MIARTVISLAKAGERDRTKLRDGALAMLTSPADDCKDSRGAV